MRSIATSEERRRLAREIHDGIAQELASLGYAVDDLVAEASQDTHEQARAGSPPLADVLRKLRGEITRMVGELRLSIFDLRSEVQAQVALGTAPLRLCACRQRRNDVLCAPGLGRVTRPPPDRRRN